MAPFWKLAVVSAAALIVAAEARPQNAAKPGKAAAPAKPGKPRSASKAASKKPPAGGEGGWEKKTKEDGQVVQSMKIEAPTMTEEDQYGYTMPDRYRCDACTAVMFHLDSGLRKIQPKNRRLKDWEYTDNFDETCRSAFKGYGIKLINGENALSGPGIPNKQDLAPGSGAIQMSSDSWTKRLMEICRKLVFEEAGEEEVYDKFWKKFSAEDEGTEETGLSADYCEKELKQCTWTKEKEKPSKPSAPKPKAKKEPKKDKSSSKKAEEKTAAKDAKAAAAAAPADGKVDASTFLREMATKHGLSSDEYRTPAEWEKFVMSIAGKLYSAKSEL